MASQLPVARAEPRPGDAAHRAGRRRQWQPAFPDDGGGCPPETRDHHDGLRPLQAA